MKSILLIILHIIKPYVVSVNKNGTEDLLNNCSLKKVMYVSPERRISARGRKNKRVGSLWWNTPLVA